MCKCVHIPSLVKVDEKHHIISETGQSVGRWHGDDEGKHVVDEGIKCLFIWNMKVTERSQKRKKKYKLTAGRDVKLFWQIDTA